MMITSHRERDEGAQPTQDELVELWNLMVKADKDEYQYLAPAKRLVHNRPLIRHNGA
jgi:hypothetical protein